MTKKRFNFKYILFALLIVSAFILSIFGLNTVDIVKADEVTTGYNYTGSSLFIPYFTNYEGETEEESQYHYAEKGFLNFAIDLTYNAYNQYVTIRFRIDKFYEKDNYNNSNSSAYFSKPSQSLVMTNSISEVNSANRVSTLSLQYIPQVGTGNFYELGRRVFVGNNPNNLDTLDSQYYNQMYMSCSYHTFNGGVSKIVVGSYPVSEVIGQLYQPFDNSFDYVNYVRYIDLNGNFLQFMFPTRSSVPLYGLGLPMVFSERTYLTNLYLMSDSAYNLGFKDGFDDYVNSEDYINAILNAQSDGRAQGYENGFNAYPNSQDYKNAINSASQSGFSNGYTKGLNEGLTLSEEDYNFTRAVSTLMGAPIDVTSRMLNFNLLGVNVWVLVSALFTLVLIIRLIKIFI